MATWLMLLTCLLPPSAASDEAILLDGGRLTGELTFTKQGQLQFISHQGATSRPLSQLAQVRFPSAVLPPFRIAAAHRVTLPDGQFLTGQFLLLDEKQLQFRTAWAEKHVLSRDAVLSVMHAPGYVTLFQDDFENGLNAWKLSGQPVRTEQQFTSGTQSLRLTASGQAAEYALLTPLSAGRVGVNFRETEDVHGAYWQLQADFEGSPERRTVRAILAGNADRFEAEISGMAPTSGRLRRKPGWHRLILEFKPTSLLLSVDEEVLCSSDLYGAGCTLRSLRLICIGRPGAKTVRGHVDFDDFSVARAVPAVRRPEGDASQDELWLLSGDQLFGSVPRANRRSLELRGKFGSRTFDWSELRGVFVRQPGAHGQQAMGERVRIWLRSGVGKQPDELVGKVIGLDGRRIQLQHDVLGELAIDRRRLHRLRLEGFNNGRN